MGQGPGGHRRWPYRRNGGRGGVGGPGDAHTAHQPARPAPWRGDLRPGLFEPAGIVRSGARGVRSLAGGQLTEPVTMAKAINLSLRDALTRDENVLIFGEDVGALGGVFRITDGLQKAFGGERGLDTPLAESAIVGVALGLALRGFRPVPEIQFDGFMYPAFDQLASHVAKYRNRTQGRMPMPITLRLPSFGGIGSPEHHSESP